MIKTVEANKIGRDFVVGDLHGCYDKLKAKLKELQFDKTRDRLFSVGDLVDRGTQNIECLQLLYEPWFHCVMGNHEQMMAGAMLENTDVNLWYCNGGSWNSRLEYDDARMVEFICKGKIGTYDNPILPYLIVINRGEDKLPSIICHAEFPFKRFVDLENQVGKLSNRQKDILTWSRTRISKKDDSVVEGVHKIYVGHTPVEYVQRLGNHNYIDTGAVFEGGKLTILEVH